MMKRFCCILLSAAALLVACIKEKQTGADLAVGDRIPEFSVMMNDGSTVSSSSLMEGISCIVFFTTECPDCQKTLPHIQKLYDEYISKGVRFLLVSREDGESAVSSYWSSNSLTMPYSAQEDRTIYELFARTRVPRVYINKDGLIKAVFTDIPANPTYEDMKAVIENL
jgi:peroxiredoxin